MEENSQISETLTFPAGNTPSPTDKSLQTHTLKRNKRSGFGFMSKMIENQIPDAIGALQKTFNNDIEKTVETNVEIKENDGVLRVGQNL